jgi:hypothetical protein
MEVNMSEAPRKPAQLAGGTSSTYDKETESRLTALESGFMYMQRDMGELKTDVRELRQDVTGIRTTDFRILFGAIIAVALGLAGLMAKGFHWL